MLNPSDGWQQIWQQFSMMMPPESLKNVDGIIRVFELQQTLSECIRARAESGDGGWQRQLLAGIRPYLIESKQYIVDLMMKCLEINDIYRMRFNQTDIL